VDAIQRALGKAAAQPEARAAAAAVSQPLGLRVLLAEDNRVNQLVAQRLLDKLSCHTDVVDNGRAAVEAVARTRYDVVLMDVQMPELDGLDASRRICERWTPEARPRIVAMTANVMPEDREACFAAGMDDYVAKPIRTDDLARALGHVRPLAAVDGDGARGTRVDLDASAVANLRELGGDEFVEEVVDTFLADAPALLATLRTAHAAGDAEELRRAAHTLKSNGQTFGAARFSELCRDLEERARQGELAGAPELVDRIDREYEALEHALAGLRPQPTT